MSWLSGPCEPEPPEPAQAEEAPAAGPDLDWVDTGSGPGYERRPREEPKREPPERPYVTRWE